MAVWRVHSRHMQPEVARISYCCRHHVLPCRASSCYGSTQHPLSEVFLVGQCLHNRLCPHRSHIQKANIQATTSMCCAGALLLPMCRCPCSCVKHSASAAPTAAWTRTIQSSYVCWCSSTGRFICKHLARSRQTPGCKLQTQTWLSPGAHLIQSQLQLFQQRRIARQRLTYHLHAFIRQRCVVQVEEAQVGLLCQACCKRRRHLSSHGVVTHIQPDQVLTCKE